MCPLDRHHMMTCLWRSSYTYKHNKVSLNKQKVFSSLTRFSLQVQECQGEDLRDRPAFDHLILPRRRNWSETPECIQHNVDSCLYFECFRRRHDSQLQSQEAAKQHWTLMYWRRIQLPLYYIHIFLTDICVPLTKDVWKDELREMTHQCHAKLIQLSISFKSWRVFWNKGMSYINI